MGSVGMAVVVGDFGCVVRRRCRAAPVNAPAPKPNRASHERLSGRGGSRLVLDHCLETLLRKPGAFPGSTPLEQARSAARFDSDTPDRTLAALRSFPFWRRSGTAT